MSQETSCWASLYKKLPPKNVIVGSAFIGTSALTAYFNYGYGMPDMSLMFSLLFVTGLRVMLEPDLLPKLER